jgi:iron complex outermembrane receptor protein
VIDLDRVFGGGDARWTYQGTLAGRAFSWIAGVSYDTQNELRRGYDNYSGTTLGVIGPLRRNENDIARNVDEYTQGSWKFLPRWTLTAGVRHSEVRFISEDHFITPTNGNDSGAVTYMATSPVAGLLFAALPWLHFYASYGQGFQTPLGSELAYRTDGGPGLNFGLRPSRSDNTEIGAKFLLGRTLSAEITGFETLTHDEIVVATSAGGRSTYQNAGRTRRSGAEASLDYRFQPDWRLQLAYTYVDAYYLDAYHTCASSPCAIPTVLVAAGNKLPGVPLNDGYVRLTFGHDIGWQASVSDQYLSSIAVNDENTAYAPAYSLLDLAGGYGTQLRSMRLRVFVRLNNVLDRHYVSAIIADNSQGNYFYPGPGFNVYAGFIASLTP